MTREIFSPSNGNNIVSTIGDRSGGTGVTQRDEVIQKFDLVGKEIIGQPGGPIPLMSGKVPRDFIEGASTNPYGIRIPAQVANKHSHQFPIEFCDAFTQYTATVDHGHVFVRDSFIHYTPEAGYKGEVILTFEGAEFKFSSVEKLLQIPIFEYFAPVGSLYGIFIKAKLAIPRYTDGSLVENHELVVTSIEKSTGGKTVPSAYSVEKVNDFQHISVALPDNHGEDIWNICFAIKNGSVLSSELEMKVSLSVGIGEQLSTPRYNMQYCYRANHDRSVVLSIETVVDHDIEATGSGTVNVLSLDKTTRRALPLQKINFHTGNTSQVFGNTGAISPSGKTIAISSGKGPTGAAGGGSVHIYRRQESGVFVFEKSITGFSTSGFATVGQIGKMLVFLDEKELLVSSTNRTTADYTGNSALYVCDVDAGTKSAPFAWPLTGNLRGGSVYAAKLNSTDIVVSSMYGSDGTDSFGGSEAAKTAARAILYRKNGATYSQVNRINSPTTPFSFGGLIRLKENVLMSYITNPGTQDMFPYIFYLSNGQLVGKKIESSSFKPIYSNVTHVELMVSEGGDYEDNGETLVPIALFDSGVAKAAIYRFRPATLDLEFVENYQELEKLYNILGVFPKAVNIKERFFSRSIFVAPIASSIGTY